MSISDSINSFLNQYGILFTVAALALLGILFLLEMVGLLLDLKGKKRGYLKGRYFEIKSPLVKRVEQVEAVVSYLLNGLIIGVLSSALIAYLSNANQLGKVFTVLGAIGAGLLVVAKVVIPVGAFVGKWVISGGLGEVGRRIMARFLRSRNILHEPSDNAKTPAKTPAPSRVVVDSTVSPPSEEN